MKIAFIIALIIAILVYNTGSKEQKIMYTLIVLAALFLNPVVGVALIIASGLYIIANSPEENDTFT